MLDGTPGEGLARVYLGKFGESWVRAVAAGCGLLEGQPSELDLQRADVQLTLRGEVRGTVDPTVQVQVKTTAQAMEVDGDMARFNVDRPTYDALRETRRMIRRVLAVVWVDQDGDRVRLEDDGTLLVGRAAWVSLEGEPASDNVAAVSVRVPLANTLDDTGLRRLLEEFGVPRSTPVPSIDPWAPQ